MRREAGANESHPAPALGGELILITTPLRQRFTDVQSANSPPRSPVVFDHTLRRVIASRRDFLI